MSKDENRTKIDARTPRGLADREAGELAATGRMLDVIREVYELYGFEALETPAIEYTDALGKFLPDQDRPNEGVFSFQDDDEQWLSLRYDLTAPLARFVAQNFDRLPKPYRSYRVGPVYRNEKPGPGRFRQFMQFDADTVGSASPAADAEICMMAADAMERLGIARGDYVIKINSRKVLDGVMQSIGLSGEENAHRRLVVLRAIDKLDRLGPDGVRQLLGEGRKDESGDFTKGAGLPLPAIDTILSFSLGGQYREGAPAFDLFGLLGKSEIGAQGAEELLEIEDLARDAGYGPDRIRIDPSVVRGLEYYTGPVFEADLTFETRDEKGNPVRFGSVGGGGRYDGLVARFKGQEVPATGFSIGVSRLYAALNMLGRRRGHESADEIRRPAQQPACDHPGLRRKGAGGGHHQGSRRRRKGRRQHRHQRRVEGASPRPVRCPRSRTRRTGSKGAQGTILACGEADHCLARRRV